MIHVKLVFWYLLSCCANAGEDGCSKTLPRGVLAKAELHSLNEINVELKASGISNAS